MAQPKQPNQNSEESASNATPQMAPKIERHSFLRLAAFGFGTSLLGGLAEKYAIEPAVDRIHEALVTPGTTQPRVVSERNSLAFELFLSSESPTEFIPATNWRHTPPNVDLGRGVKTYGHEAAVLQSIVAATGKDASVWDISQEPWLAHAAASQVMLGSGQSNKATGEVIGSPDKPNVFPRIGNRTVNLAYAISTGDGSALKRLQYNEDYSFKALAICDPQGRGLVQAQTKDGYQDDDYLLLTRVPGPVAGTVLTIFSGLHGPGTRSAELLFQGRVSISDLETLAGRINHQSGRIPYYQAVFRASKFEQHDGSFVPTHIELVTDTCAPAVV